MAGMAVFMHLNMPYACENGGAKEFAYLYEMRKNWTLKQGKGGIEHVGKSDMISLDSADGFCMCAHVRRSEKAAMCRTCPHMKT
jgi:hypothetical protein